MPHQQVGTQFLSRRPGSIKPRVRLLAEGYTGRQTMELLGHNLMPQQQIGAQFLSRQLGSIKLRV